MYEFTYLTIEDTCCHSVADMTTYLILAPMLTRVSTTIDHPFNTVTI